MTPILYAQLITQFGLPLVQQIWTMTQSGNKPLTQEDFDALNKLAAYRSADSLAAAGIKIENGKVVPL